MFEVGSSPQNALYRETIGCKGFRTFAESKTITLTPWKRNYYPIIRKSLELKVCIHAPLRRTSQKHKSPFSSNIIYHYFYPGIFKLGIYMLSSSLLKKAI